VGEGKRCQGDQVKARLTIGTLSIAGLAGVFLFQELDLSAVFGLSLSPAGKFIFNRSVRFLLNDGLTVLLIYALFCERKYVIFAIYVQLAGLVFVLIPYFIAKMYFPNYNGPLISFIHRLVLNPLILLLLIPAFYYQKQSRPPSGTSQP
jgi:exosortase F-associated protein